MVPQRPFFQGRPGWVRSNAWIWHFSSSDKTIAFAGGCRYKPVTSSSFSAKRGSLLSLKLLTRCGFKPCARQIRPTVDALTPTAGANVRVLQWVATSGVWRVVFSTISAILAGRIKGRTPRTGRIMFYPFHALCLESAQPPTHGLTRHVQSLCNFLGTMSRRTQQQHLRPLYQSRRQRAASCIALEIILLLPT